MKMFCLDWRTAEPISLRSEQLLDRLSTDVRPSAQTTFEMEVKGRGGPGGCWENSLLTLLTKCELLVQLAATEVNGALTNLMAASEADCSAAPRYALNYMYKPVIQSPVVY